MRFSISFLFTLLIGTLTIALAAPVPSRTSVTHHSNQYLKDHDHLLDGNVNPHQLDIDGAHNLQPRANRLGQKAKEIYNRIKNTFTRGNKKKPAEEPSKGKNRKSTTSWGGNTHASTRWSMMSGASQPNNKSNRNSKTHRRDIEFEGLEQLE